MCPCPRGRGRASRRRTNRTSSRPWRTPPSSSRPSRRRACRRRRPPSRDLAPAPRRRCCRSRRFFCGANRPRHRGSNVSRHRCALVEAEFFADPSFGGGVAGVGRPSCRRAGDQGKRSVDRREREVDGRRRDRPCPVRGDPPLRRRKRQDGKGTRPCRPRRRRSVFPRGLAAVRETPARYGRVLRHTGRIPGWAAWAHHRIVRAFGGRGRGTRHMGGGGAGVDPRRLASAGDGTGRHSGRDACRRLARAADRGRRICGRGRRLLIGDRSALAGTSRSCRDHDRLPGDQAPSSVAGPDVLELMDRVDSGLGRRDKV